MFSLMGAKATFASTRLLVYLLTFLCTPRYLSIQLVGLRLRRASAHRDCWTVGPWVAPQLRLENLTMALIGPWYCLPGAR